MSALELLRGSLGHVSERVLNKPLRHAPQVDEALSDLRRTLSSASDRPISQDQQMEALRRFRSGADLVSFRDTRMVSFALMLRAESNQRCLLEERDGLKRLLRSVSGYGERPRQFRRCYQGLLAGYFEYPIDHKQQAERGSANWNELRDYLKSHVGAIQTGGVEPVWVESITKHRGLFDDNPCRSYGTLLLDGRIGDVEKLKQDLGISSSSWFSRQLILAFIQAATKLPDEGFIAAIPKVLEAIKANVVVSDKGLALVLDRYAAISEPQVSPALRDTAVERWGNPWLSSNAVAWQRVATPAKQMVTAWLKEYYVQTFFSVLAEEHPGDSRRLQFWQGYLESMDSVHFALGTAAQTSIAPDVVALRRRMEGLWTPLKDPVPASNAFIMRMGEVTVVEFSGHANACYGYSGTLPFDLHKAVVTPVDHVNSLKHSRHAFKWLHQDNRRKFGRWEEGFADGLHRDFGLAPSRAPQRGTRSALRERQPTLYSKARLEQFCADRSLTISDRTKQGGGLWVRTDNQNPGVVSQLTLWGFAYKPTKGWWKW